MSSSEVDGPAPAGVDDPDRRWSVMNSRGAGLVIVVLLVGLAARALDLEWGTWLGYGAGAVAVLGVLVSMGRGFSGPPAPTAAPAERRRIARQVRRARPVAVEDTLLADILARAWLRSLGVSSWGGPLVASGQVGAVPFRGTGDGVLKLLLLVLGLSVGVGALWFSARARRSLIDQPRRGGPTD